MREIKFRAWDVARKIMIEWRELSMYPMCSFNEYYMNTGKTKVAHFMQYAWLKDKNWKEIYEGDIVENDWCIWVVEFFDNLYRDGWGSIHSWFYCKERCSYGTELSYTNWFNNVEVKGNIRENKDLLSNQ